MLFLKKLVWMLPEWANLISSYSLSDNLDWSPSPLCRWTEPETNVLSLFCFNLQTLWWRRVAQTSMGVLASQTGQMQNELWQLQGQIWENWIPEQHHLHIRQFQSLNLWKPPDGVLDHVPRNRECNETLPQMVVERGNAYCVGVKVDASIFENHL